MRSNRKKLITEKVVIPIYISAKKAVIENFVRKNIVEDNIPKSSLSLKSNTISAKRLTTFKKEIAIDSPELTRMVCLKDLLTSQMKLLTGKCILADKCYDKDFVLIGPNSKACKDCGLPIHIKCAITMGLKFNNSFYCSHDCMRGDGMKHNGHPFKCVTRYEDEDYFFYLRKVDTIKEVLFQFFEIIMGNSY